MEIETKKMKRQFSSNHNTAKPTVIKDLPKAILVQILLKLPSKSLFCLRCVSKAFSRSVDDHSFIALHNRLLVDAKGAVDVPQLLAAKNVRSSSSSNFVALRSVKYDGSCLTKGNYAVKVSSSMYLHFVFQNLFGFRLCGDEQQFLLVNPLSMRLPTSSNIQHLTRNQDPEVRFVYYYGMGFDKTSNKHKIVRVRRICRDDYRLLYAGTHVLELGTTSWREIDSAVPGNWRLLDGACACGDIHWCASGDTHWLNRSALQSGIITFDFTKEGFYMNPTPPGSFSSNKNLHLLTIRGALAIVTTSSSADTTQIEIWVMKDYDRKVWMQEYTVNVGVFSDCGLKFATCGEWEHGIYFNHSSRDSEIICTSFLDLRSTSIRCFIYPLMGYKHILSYTGSLMSLQDYDNLVDGNELVKHRA